MTIKYKQLSEVASFSNDKTSLNTVNIHNYVSTENMLPNKGGITTATNLPDSEKVRKYEKGNILISNIRPYFKKIWYSNKEGGCSNDILVLKSNSEVESEYLYYILSSNDFFDYVTSTSKGTKMPRGDKSAIMLYDIPVYSLEDQKRIINILSNIDKKIDTNIRINNNLENLSKTIFSQYFELFEFPNKEGKPYKSSGGEFKDSSIGPIPKNWDLKTIDELSIVKGRIGWRGYRSSDLVDNGPWVIGGKEINSNTVNLSGAKHITRSKYDESPEIKLMDHDILLAKTGTIGPVAMYYKEYGEATINPNTCIIRVKNNYSSLLLTFLKSERAQYYLKEYTTSSVQPAINQTNIKKLTLPLPNDENMLKSYSEIFNKINESQKHLNAEINKLTKLRDTLLPKLMSGEIDVSNINFDLE